MMNHGRTIFTRNRRSLACAATVAILALWSGTAQAQGPDAEPATWSAILSKAEGQTVYFEAWGGSQNINDYILWVGEEVRTRYGITLNHVELEDTATSIAKVVAEKAVGRDEGGSVDLIWIKGENFASMQEQGLLSEGFATQLPNWQYVDTVNPSVTTDFTIPTDGQEFALGLGKDGLLLRQRALECRGHARLGRGTWNGRRTIPAAFPIQRRRILSGRAF